MVDKRKKMHKDMIQHMLANIPGMLATTIPYSSEIERMGLERKPLGAFSKTSVSTMAYNELWQEILARIKVGG
jgi:cellulose biosynthesis protein BcsQ